MSMMIGDTRACAQAVNDLMASAAQKRGGPTFDREVEYKHKVYVFGHYDSRGGAVAIVAKNVRVAMEKYAKVSGWAEEGQDLNKLDDYVWDGAYEDLQSGGILNLVFCDAKPQDEQELLLNYEEGGYKTARVQSRWFDTYGKKFHPWEDTDLILLWKGEDEGEDEGDSEGVDPAYMADAPKMTPPQPGPLKYEYRLVRYEPGEDACGLVLIDKP